MKVTLFPFMCLLVITASQSNGQVTPGAQIQISTSGLNYAAKVALDNLSKRVTKMQIPDMSGKSKIGGAGKVEYSFSNNQVNGFTTPASHITTKPLGWTISKINIKLHGDWRYNAKIAFIPVRDHGSYDLELYDCVIAVTVTLTLHKSRPLLIVQTCSVTVGSVDVHFHGGASWLYNLFADTVEKNIKQALQSQLTDEVEKYINENANEVLASMDVLVPLQNFTLDYSFLSPPLATPTHILSKNKAEIYFGSDRTEAPFSAAPLPALLSGSDMVSIQLSEYIINTFAYSAFKHHQLIYNLTKADLKDTGYLNTTCRSTLCIGSLIPELGKVYPNSSVSLELRATLAPIMSISEQDMSVSFNGSTVFTVQQPGKSAREPAFITYTNVSFSVNASIEENVMKAYVCKPKITLKLVKSYLNISSTSIANLDTILNWLVSGFVNENLNTVIGDRGFKLPEIKDVKYINPRLTLQKGALTVGTDVHYIG